MIVVKHAHAVVQGLQGLREELQAATEAARRDAAAAGEAAQKLAAAEAAAAALREEAGQLRMQLAAAQEVRRPLSDALHASALALQSSW